MNKESYFINLLCSQILDLTFQKILVLQYLENIFQPFCNIYVLWCGKLQQTNFFKTFSATNLIHSHSAFSYFKGIESTSVIILTKTLNFLKSSGMKYDPILKFTMFTFTFPLSVQIRMIERDSERTARLVVKANSVLNSNYELSNTRR
jgi:hypothetical protein